MPLGPRGPAGGRAYPGRCRWSIRPLGRPRQCAAGERIPGHHPALCRQHGGGRRLAAHPLDPRHGRHRRRPVLGGTGHLRQHPAPGSQSSAWRRGHRPALPVRPVRGALRRAQPDQLVRDARPAVSASLSGEPGGPGRSGDQRAALGAPQSPGHAAPTTDDGGVPGFAADLGPATQGRYLPGQRRRRCVDPDQGRIRPHPGQAAGVHPRFRRYLSGPRHADQYERLARRWRYQRLRRACAVHVRHRAQRIEHGADL
ncbi:hypothetical protein D3C76_900360 [compost metagenome]